MHQHTIAQLANLNHYFYQSVAQSFDASRQVFWPGWYKLNPHIEELMATSVEEYHRLSVLDVGCGNARFASFLHQQLPEFNGWIDYYGVDGSEQLLQAAEKRLTGIYNFTLQQKNLLQLTLPSVQIDNGKHHLVVSMAVMHHIPSFTNRSRLILNLAKQVVSGGRLVVSFWQFADVDSIQKKILSHNRTRLEFIPWAKNHLSRGVKWQEILNDFEEGDYLLDWKSNQQGFRYCHSFSDNEIDQLITSSGLKVVDRYKADGSSGDMNQYVVLGSGV